jgi:hypothetical protein
VLTHFPYSLPLDLGFDQDSGVYEFPVTFEDEESPPLIERVDAAIDVIRANAEIGGINVLLIHPNQAGQKLAAEQKLLERLPARVKPMDLQKYALYWRARDQLRWSVLPGRSSHEVTLLVTTGEPVSGTTFEFTRNIETAENATLMPGGRRIVLQELNAHQTVNVRVRYSPF